MKFVSPPKVIKYSLDNHINLDLIFVCFSKNEILSFRKKHVFHLVIVVTIVYTIFSTQVCLSISFSFVLGEHFQTRGAQYRHSSVQFLFVDKGIYTQNRTEIQDARETSQILYDDYILSVSICLRHYTFYDIHNNASNSSFQILYAPSVYCRC